MKNKYIVKPQFKKAKITVNQKSTSITYFLQNITQPIAEYLYNIGYRDYFEELENENIEPFSEDENKELSFFEIVQKKRGRPKKCSDCTGKK